VENQPIYKDKIIYQIYPLSFCDSNNDGIGDLNGIISKLDYLHDLGIGLIWLSPIYASPMHDNGYDISDYYSINPLFGTMEDFDNLIIEAKKRDIGIVMDLVINHTSNEHIWFKEALKDKNSKYRNYYIFKEGKKGKVPNNWQSAFTGCPWEKAKGEENMYYLHLYTPEQPDLNYKNEEVIKEVENILEFYLKKGVKGFRCDVINQIYKTTLKNGKRRIFGVGKEHYENQEGNFKILERLQNKIVKKYGGFLVGETSNVTIEVGKQFLSRGCLNMFFEFEHAFCDENKFCPVFKIKYKPKKLINPILKWQENIDWIGAYLENHDQRRSLSRFGYSEDYLMSSKMLAIFLLTLKGTVFIYQGEEIGVRDNPNFKYEDLNDAMGKSIIETICKLLHTKKETAFNMLNKTVNRDQARNPMMWNKQINGGFNEGNKTWLKVNPLYKEGINVEDELRDPNSTLNFYKKLIELRNHSEILKYGTFTRIKSNKNVAKFIREFNNEKLLIVVNMSNKKIKDKRDDLEVIITNNSNIDNKYLYPMQGIIYKLK